MSYVAVQNWAVLNRLLNIEGKFIKVENLAANPILNTLERCLKSHLKVVVLPSTRMHHPWWPPTQLHLRL
jgi:hypothetical protein